MTKLRKIIHVDMDAFFASIEQRDHPKFRNHPLIVAKDPRLTNGRGVVATASYEARKFGVHSAMPAATALKLCPEAIFKIPDFVLYRKVSDQVHEIFHEFTDKIETVALDEAYLDVTENKKAIKNPVLISHLIQSEIFEKTRLTSSAGISYNKFLAKEASDFAKPVGFTVIKPEDAREFLIRLKIGQFRGVGKQTAKKMKRLRIENGADLLSLSQMEMIKQFGKFGYVLYQRARGIDERPVEYQRIRKSIGKEKTFNPVLTTQGEVENQLRKLAKQVVDSLNRHQKHGKTIVLKVRYSDFETDTKRVTFDEFIENHAEVILRQSMNIFAEFPIHKQRIRLLGITVTNLSDLGFENLTLSL